MSNSGIKISFIDPFETVFYQRYCPLDSVIADFISFEDEDPRINIEFLEIDALESVELFINSEADTAKLMIDYSLDGISRQLGITDENFDEKVDNLEDAIRSHGKRIREIFEMDDLAIFWGGPENEENNYMLGVDFYMDESWEYLLVHLTFNLSELRDSLTLASLKSKIERMSTVIQDIRSSL